MNDFNENNFNPYENPDERPPYPYPPLQKRQAINPFETAATICSLVSLLSCLTFYGPYIFGAMAILFALLSRGGNMKMSPKAKRSVFFAISGMVLTTVVFIMAFQYALELYGSLEGIVREFCSIYGYDFEELYGDLFTQYNSLQQ